MAQLLPHLRAGAVTTAVDLTYMYLYCGAMGLLFGLAGVVAGRLVEIETGCSPSCCWAASRHAGDTTWVGRMALSVVPSRIGIGLEPEFPLWCCCLSLAVLAALALDRLVPNSGWRAAGAVAAIV